MSARLLLPALLLVLLAAPAAAQQRLFDDGANGVGVAGAVSFPEDATALGLDFSFTWRARYDLGVTIQRATYDEDAYGPDFNGVEVTGHATAALVRPRPGAPFGCEVTAAYGAATFSGDVLRALDADLSGDAIVAGGAAYLALAASPTLAVYPTVGVAYGRTTLTQEDRFRQKTEVTTEDVQVTVAVDLRFGGSFYLEPGVATFDGHATWYLAAGVLVPSP